MSLLALPAFQLSNTWLYPIIGSRIGFIPQLSHNIIDLFYNWSHNSPSILQHFSGSTPCNRWSDAMALLAALTKPPVPPLRPVGSRGSWSSWIPLVEILQKFCRNIEIKITKRGVVSNWLCHTDILMLCYIIIPNLSATTCHKWFSTSTTIFCPILSCWLNMVYVTR